MRRGDYALVEERSPAEPSLPWLDAMKGLALLWIVLNHIVERVAGSTYLGSPSIPWVPMEQRVAPWTHPVDSGVLGFLATLVRDAGWVGDEGVTVFVILTGFGLTWGLLQRRAEPRLDLATFYHRRFVRILPMWWAAHLLFVPSGWFVFHGLSTGDWQFYASFFGLRFLPQAFYYFSPAWWYVGLLIQLYLVFPLLWRQLRTRGPATLLAACCAIGFGSLALGVKVYAPFYYQWHAGAFCITRLPEFAAGMVWANAWFANPERTQQLMRRPATWIAGVALYLTASLLALTFWGNIVTPVMLGASAVVVLFPLAIANLGPATRALRFLGQHSYSIYLVHHPIVLSLIRPEATSKLLALEIAAAGSVTAILSFTLERFTRLLEIIFGVLAKRDVRFPWIAAAALFIGIIGVPILADLAIAARDPQEVHGWGERASLVPDAAFGWKMRPSSQTRLRWESYDYTVTANRFGFPAPAFAERKPANTTRVFVLGDAYTSAEGVNTAQSWPRMLQDDLARAHPGRRYEVLNFAITGYGPNQEEAVARTFVPKFRPDIVLIANDPTDIEDTLISNDRFRDSIGFALPPQRGLLATLELLQLRRWLSVKITQRIGAVVKHRPYEEGYNLGGFRYLERGHTDFERTGEAIMTRRYQEIRALARSVGATAMAAWIPSASQICKPSDLRYYPNVDLLDTNRYDLGLPLRLLRSAATAADLPIVSLDRALAAAPQCPYQPDNMHFTPLGHSVVAAELAARLSRASHSGGDL